jgi:hypothetical protein
LIPWSVIPSRGLPSGRSSRRTPCTAPMSTRSPLRRLRTLRQRRWWRCPCHGKKAGPYGARLVLQFIEMVVCARAYGALLKAALKSQITVAELLGSAAPLKDALEDIRYGEGGGANHTSTNQGNTLAICILWLRVMLNRDLNSISQLHLGTPRAT